MDEKIDCLYCEEHMQCAQKSDQYNYLSNIISYNVS